MRYSLQYQWAVAITVNSRNVAGCRVTMLPLVYFLNEEHMSVGW